MNRLIISFFILILLSYSFLMAQPTVDGNLNDIQYTSLATKLNSTSGFPGTTDVTEIVYYPDVTNSILYIGVKCVLDNTLNEGIGLWLNFSELNGATSGTSLGTTGAGHYMSGSGNPNFIADFEVDYMFAWNPNTSSSICRVDAVKLVSGPSIEFLGDCGQSGTAITNIGGVFSSGTVLFAFQNGGGTHGFEINIPFNQLNVTSTGSFSAFAFAVRSTAEFSDITVPGNITTGNPGFDPNFNSISGGPYHTAPDVSLPVTLASFSAAGGDGYVVIKWVTHSEVDNDLFIIDRSTDGQNFPHLIQVNGSGNSNTTKRYKFIDRNVVNDTRYYYRLADKDFLGNITYHNIVSATPHSGVKIVKTDPEKPDGFFLYDNYPNPFNPETTIEFDLSSDLLEEQFVNLSIYNIDGQKIGILINKTLSNGNYTVQWDGTNDHGKKVSSGIYLYRLSTPDFVKTKKLMLIR